MRPLALMPILCVTACLGQQVSDSNFPNAQLVKLSEIIKDQAQFQNKVVRVQAKYLSGYFLETIWDAGSKGRVWASFDEHLSENTKPSTLSQYENLFGKNVTVDVTVVGFLLPPNKSHTEGGRVYQFGFGHLHSWDFEFHVLSIETIR